MVDPAAHDRGRALWATHCVDCHGPQARGSDTGPNIIRTKTVNFDRTAQQAGSVLGPFLKAGHPTQSEKPSASFTDDEIVALANFLRQRVNDTMRGSPIFTVGDIVVGDAKAGEAYFNGAGGCATCHNATQRAAWPASPRAFPRRSICSSGCCFPARRWRAAAGAWPRGAAAAGRGAPAADRNAVTVSIASGSRAPRCPASSSRRATST